MWHYLDDFITIGQAQGNAVFTTTFYTTCDKCEGPTTCIMFLSLVIDSRAMELRLRRDKLRRVKAELKLWQHKKRCTKRVTMTKFNFNLILSLMGLLQHAARVVRLGHTFLRCLYDLLAAANVPSHHIYIQAAARSDLAWWGLFVDAWNGLSLLYTHQLSSPQHEVVSDTSGSSGCGAYSGRQWFQLIETCCIWHSPVSFEWKKRYRPPPGTTHSSTSPSGRFCGLTASPTAALRTSEAFQN